jgi:hypothetical protein
MIIRHWLTFGSIGIALGFLATTASFTEAKKYSGGSEKSSIYYKTQAQADAALDQFDKANPNCQLWTNWQKMCSRLGKQGENTHCNTDPSFPSRPTRPFCIASLESQLVTNAEQLPNSEDIDVLNVYCARIEKVDGKSLCRKMKARRPFNGLSLAALRHPFCEVWSKNSKKICSESGSSPGIPTCSNIINNKQGSGKFYCETIISGDERVEYEYGCRKIFRSFHPNYVDHKMHSNLEYNSEITPVKTTTSYSSFFDYFYCKS